jgi:hypothetical protein
MSKVEDLKQKYPAVTNASFNRFLSADTTTTKKYLDFMLKTWEDRKNPDASYRTVTSIIDLVKKYNDLLPYIQNKDIYSKEYYGNLEYLVSVIEKATNLREEKTFKREEHAVVLLETDKYLFIQPTTKRGSMKYGGNTKWCTTSKTDISVFDRYANAGLLVYLIDKTETTSNNYKKVAFYNKYSNKSLNTAIELYSVSDSTCNEGNLLSNGWDEDDLFKIFTVFRYQFIKSSQIKKNKDYVNSFVSTITKLDFSELEKHLKTLEESVDVDYIKNVQVKVESFIEQINKTKYATIR